jgi:hypothetical protein
MVIEFAMNMVMAVLWGFVTVLDAPDVLLPADSPFVIGYSLINAAIPLDAMLTAFGLTLLIIGATFPYFLAIYVYRLIPFKMS